MEYGEVWVALVIALFVYLRKIFLKRKNKKEPMSEEWKEFLDDAEYKDFRMPDGQFVSMPVEKNFEKKTLMYRLLYGDLSEEE